jgi:hypothetical protein
VLYCIHHLLMVSEFRFVFFVFFFCVFFMVGRGRKGVSLFVQVYTPLTYQVQLNEMKINFLGTLIRLIDNNH